MEPIIKERDPIINVSLGGIVDGGPFRRSNLKPYIGRMSQGDSKALFDDNVEKILLEQGFDVTEDPRSIYEPEQLWKALERYGPQNSKRVLIDAPIKAGFNLARKVFARPEFRAPLKPLSELDLLIQAVDLSKFAGLPTMVKKKDALPYTINRELQVRKGIKAPSPCLAGKRTQENNKTRLIWQYPFEMTMMESRFARPLIETYLHHKRTTMAFGLKKFELGSYLASNVLGHGHIYTLDYSKFDSSIPALLIHVAFDIMGTWFSSEDKEEYGWKLIERYFVNTPIVMINGHLYLGKKHGVPSGSYFTQLVDSIVNTMLIGALFYALNQPVDWHRVFVLGDDCIFPMHARVPLDKIARILSMYGITLNVMKSKIGEMHFLGADWSKTIADAPIEHIISRAVSPETFRKKPVYLTSRQFALIVLSGYATAYASGSLILPYSVFSGGYKHYDTLDYKANPKLLPGWLRFKLEQQERVFDQSKSSSYSTIDAQFWS